MSRLTPTICYKLIIQPCPAIPTSKKEPLLQRQWLAVGGGHRKKKKYISSFPPLASVNPWGGVTSTEQMHFQRSDFVERAQVWYESYVKKKKNQRAANLKNVPTKKFQFSYTIDFFQYNQFFRSPPVGWKRSGGRVRLQVSSLSLLHTWAHLKRDGQWFPPSGEGTHLRDVNNWPSPLRCVG